MVLWWFVVKVKFVGAGATPKRAQNAQAATAHAALKAQTTHTYEPNRAAPAQRRGALLLGRAQPGAPDVGDVEREQRGKDGRVPRGQQRERPEPELADDAHACVCFLGSARVLEAAAALRAGF